MPDASRNHTALTCTIQVMGRKAAWAGMATLILIVISGVLGGLACMAHSSSPGWGSVYFLVGAGQMLVIAAPVGVLLYVSITLVAGLTVFLRMRFGKGLSNQT